MQAAAAAMAVAALVLSGAAAARERLSEVPLGTRFLIELRNKLEARKIHEGKKFEARTLEPIQATDGSYIPAGSKVRGRVTSVSNKQMVLQVETIEVYSKKTPVVATVTGVVGDKNVKSRAGEEGEIKSASHRGRDAAIGAAVVGGIGAAVGASQGGGKGAAIGAGAGAATGAALGAAAGGGKDLVLREGTRIEVELDRPLVFRSRR
jgi:hypothetical protein